MSSASRTADVAPAELRRVGDRAQGTAQSALEEGKAVLAEAAESGRQIAQAELDRLRHALDDVLGMLKHVGEDGASKARDAVAARPMTSVAGAFAVGFLAAVLLRR